MKISIVNGSPRKNGTTAKILIKMKFILEQKPDVTIEYFDLSQYDMTLCKGCLVCYKTGRCVIPDDQIEEIADRIKVSDGVIIGSPTYGSNISGQLKAFMDRGHFIVEQSLTGKYGFSVATYQIAEGKAVLNVIKKFFLVSGASRKGELLLKTGITAADWKRGFERMVKLRTERFYEAVKGRKRKSVFEYIFTNVILLPIIWKPLFLKNRQMYEGVLRIWKEKGIL